MEDSTLAFCLSLGNLSLSNSFQLCSVIYIFFYAIRRLLFRLLDVNLPPTVADPKRLVNCRDFIPMQLKASPGDNLFRAISIRQHLMILFKPPCFQPHFADGPITMEISNNRRQFPLKSFPLLSTS